MKPGGERDRAAAINVDATPTAAAIKLMEEMRARDEFNGSDLVVDVILDPTVTIYLQTSSEPKRRYLDPRTRGNKELDKGANRLSRALNAIKREAQAKAVFYRRALPVILGAVVGTTYSGEEIGEAPGLYVEFIRESPTGRGEREDYYVPANAIDRYSLRAPVASQGK